jgi:hypothetical protein
MVLPKIRVKRIPAARNCAMALQAISRQQTVTEIARNFYCSRTTVHEQKNRALEAGANEFKDAADDEPLFTISGDPVIDPSDGGRAVLHLQFKLSRDHVFSGEHFRLSCCPGIGVQHSRRLSTYLSRHFMRTALVLLAACARD